MIFEFLRTGNLSRSIFRSLHRGLPRMLQEPSLWAGHPLVSLGGLGTGSGSHRHAKDRHGSQPLHVSAKHGTRFIAELLIHRRAQLDVRAGCSVDAVLFAPHKTKSAETGCTLDSGLSPLAIAKRNGRKSFVRWLRS